MPKKATPGAFDLFHSGHLKLLRPGKRQCDFLIVGVVSDHVLITHKGGTAVIPVEIVGNVRCIDAARPAISNDKLEVWRELRFDVLFTWRLARHRER